MRPLCVLLGLLAYASGAPAWAVIVSAAVVASVAEVLR